MTGISTGQCLEQRQAKRKHIKGTVWQIRAIGPEANITEDFQEVTQKYVKEGVSLMGHRRNLALLRPWLWICSLQKCETVSFSWFQAPHPNLWHSWQQPQETSSCMNSLQISDGSIGFYKTPRGRWSQTPRRSFAGDWICMFTHWDNSKTQRKKPWQKEPGRQQGSWVEALASSSVKQAKVCGVSFWSLMAVQTGTNYLPLWAYTSPIMKWGNSLSYSNRRNHELPNLS
jgi:hypothetical protein